MARYPAIYFGILVFALPCTGCFVRQAQLDRVEARLVVIEKTNASVMADSQRETKRLENLGKAVEEANDSLRGNVAQSQAKIDGFEHTLTKLRGEIEELVHRLEVLEKTSGAAQTGVGEVRHRLAQLIADLRDRAGIAILALPAELPTDGFGFVKLAEKYLADGEARVAAAVANECQKRYVDTEFAAGCGLVLGRIAVQEARYVDALRIFQAVHDGLNGKPIPIVGQALIEVAKTMELQGKCASAQKCSSTCLRRCPNCRKRKLPKNSWIRRVSAVRKALASRKPPCKRSPRQRPTPNRLKKRRKSPQTPQLKKPNSRGILWPDPQQLTIQQPTKRLS